jgi:hypothetical protein
LLCDPIVGLLGRATADTAPMKIRIRTAMVLVALVALCMWAETTRRRWVYFRRQAEVHAKQEQDYRSRAAFLRQLTVIHNSEAAFGLELEGRLRQQSLAYRFAEGRLLEGEHPAFLRLVGLSREAQAARKDAIEAEATANGFLQKAAEEARLKREFLSRW